MSPLAELLNSMTPTITISPNNAVSTPGDRVVFECAATGQPGPTIFWEKLHSAHFPTSARVLKSGTLVIDPVTSDEGGIYRCIARNGEGEDYRDVTLEVRGEVVITFNSHYYVW